MAPDSDAHSHTAGDLSRARGRSFSSIAEDVLGKKVRFGRFAPSWLSRKTLGFPGFGTVDRGTTEALMANDQDNNASAKDGPGSPAGDDAGKEGETKEPEQTDIGDEDQDSSAETEAESSLNDQTVELLPKLLHYTKILFASQNFFFAYDYDITRQIGTQEVCNGHRPLHTLVDPLVGLIPFKSDPTVS